MTTTTEVNESEAADTKQTIRNSLFKYCTDGATGIVFLTTKTNKACRIFLTEGKIKAMTLGKFGGQEAAFELDKVGLKAASFSDKFEFPYANKAEINSSSSLLKQYGYIDRAPRS